MHFLTPAAFGFALAMLAVILLYLLKRKRLVHLVPSTVLWRRYLAETRASAPFQRLRNSWILWLQLAWLALAVLALARPFRAAPTDQGRLLVMILDASASMQCRDEAPSRFEAARAQLGQWINSLQESDQMVLIQAAAATEVRQSRTSDKGALRRALAGCETTDGPTRLAEAVKLADTLSKEQALAEIHLFSDGAAPDLQDVTLKTPQLAYHRVGRQGRNAGIVSVDVRAHPENPAERAVFVGVANFDTNEIKAELELRFEERLIGVKPLSLGPRETRQQVLLAPQDRDGVFTVRLNTEDDLAVDNQAWVWSPLPKPTRVLLVTKGNRFLSRALEAAPLVELTETADYGDGAGRFDVAVFDKVSPAAWPAGGILAFQAAGPDWFTNATTLEQPVIVDWNAAHPLLRFVSFDAVQVARSRAVPMPDWAVSLVEAPRASLILAGQRQQQRIIWVGFDILESTWPLRVSFPIFIANAVEWLSPASSQAGQFMVRTGSPLRLPAPRDLEGQAAAWTVIRPDGSRAVVPAEPGRAERFFGGTTRQGLYRLEAGGSRETYCVNLLDAPESDVTPRFELQVGKSAAAAVPPARLANLEGWRWIAAAGLGVLLFEWWFYHRRTA